MELTEYYKFKTSKIQKKTLIVLKKKYRINTSEFIRKAITEKLEREKNSIFKNYNDIQKFIKELEEVPF